MLRRLAVASLAVAALLPGADAAPATTDTAFGDPLDTVQDIVGVGHPATNFIVLCSSVTIRGNHCRGAKIPSVSARYGRPQTTRSYPVFVPEAGEIQLLTTTGPS